MSKLEENWSKTLEILGSELNEVQYKTWILPLVPIKVDEKQNILYVESDNNMVISRLNDRYLQLLEGAVNLSFKKPLSVHADLVEQKKPREKNINIDAK